MRAARFADAGDEPPNAIAGRGSCAGRGRMRTVVAAPLERLAGPRLLEHLDAVLHQRRPALDVEVELLVLLGPVAGPTVSRRRPCEMRSSTARSSASRIGW